MGQKEERKDREKIEKGRENVKDQRNIIDRGGKGNKHLQEIIIKILVIIKTVLNYKNNNDSINNNQSIGGDNGDENDRRIRLKVTATIMILKNGRERLSTFRLKKEPFTKANQTPAPGKKTLFTPACT